MKKFMVAGGVLAALAVGIVASLQPAILDLILAADAYTIP